MKEYQKIILELPSGDRLVAEECPFDDAQIAVGIVDKNDNWVQDLTVIDTRRLNEFNVYVYSDEHNESYTHKYTVNRILSNAI